MTLYELTEVIAGDYEVFYRDIASGRPMYVDADKEDLISDARVSLIDGVDDSVLIQIDSDDATSALHGLATL